MPPHCDSLSGPVVKMAKKALETGNVNFILPYVPKESEGEIIAAFKKVLAEPLREECFALLRRVKEYELLTVDAAVHGDRQAALAARSGQAPRWLARISSYQRRFQ